MSGVTTQQYVGNINGQLLEDFRKVQNELEVIMRNPQSFSTTEQQDHAHRRTLVIGKVLHEFWEQGGQQAVSSRINSDNGAVFLTYQD